MCKSLKSIEKGDIRSRRKRRSSSAAIFYDGDVKNMIRIQRDTVRYDPAFRVVSSGKYSEKDLDDGIYFALPGYSVKVWSSFNDCHISSSAFHLCVIDRQHGTIDFVKAYSYNRKTKDTNGRRLRHLVHDLNGVPKGKIVVVFTTGCPGRGDQRICGGLPDALVRCGATNAVFQLDSIEEYGAYVLIGFPGLCDA